MKRVLAALMVAALVSIAPVFGSDDIAQRTARIVTAAGLTMSQADVRGSLPPPSDEPDSEPVLPFTPREALDYPELPGWPMIMSTDPNYGPGGGPAMVDVDGDGRMEVFAGSSSLLYGWSTAGLPLPGFPVQLDGLVQSAPAVGDIDGDGQLDILIATRTGGIYAFQKNGAIKSGWPVRPGNEGGLVSVVLQDFNGDGVPEVVYPNGNYLYVWRGDGTNYPGFPVYFASSLHVACATPAIGDLDGDGMLEIVVEGWEWLNVFHQDGTIAAGWPYHLPQDHGFSYSAPALVDFDGDGHKEIAAAYHENGGNYYGKICVWRDDGTVVPGWPVFMQNWSYSTPAIGDVDEDGFPELAVLSHNGKLYVLNFDSTRVPGFPVYTGWPNLEAYCSIADIDDDNHLEIVFGSNFEPGVFMSFEKDGTVTPGFPIPMASAMMPTGSCIDDADADGNVNICALDVLGNVHMWNLPFAFHKHRVPWGRPHHDDFHTGNVAATNPSAVENDPELPALRFEPVWPNPSAGPVSFLLKGTEPSQPVRLSIVDLAGRKVASVENGAFGAGQALFTFDPSRVDGGRIPAGVYFCRALYGGRAFARSFVYKP